MSLCTCNLLADTAVADESAKEELIMKSDKPRVVENKHSALKNLAVVAGKELIATSDMTMEVKNKLIEMDAHDAIFIQEKTLTRTDVNENENRLVLTSKATTILKEEEKTRLEERAGQGQSSFKGIEVLVLDASATERTLLLKPRKNGKFAVTKKWKEIMKQGAITVGDKVKLWSFRSPSQSEICFLIYKARKSHHQSHPNF